MAEMGKLASVGKIVTMALSSGPSVDGEKLDIFSTPDRDVKSGLENKDRVLNSDEVNPDEPLDGDDDLEYLLLVPLLLTSPMFCLPYASANILRMSTGLCGA